MVDAEKEIGKEVHDKHSTATSRVSEDAPSTNISISRAIAPAEADGKKAERKDKWKRRIITIAKEQWFLLGVGVVILIASQVQVPKQHQDVKRTAVTYLAVAIIFLLTGCTLKTQTLLDNYGRWKLHLFVQIQSYLMTSAVVYGVVSAAATNPNFMDPGLLLGLILAGSVATTISSNVVMTGQAHGNQALTVVQSTLGNFLGPFLTPALFTMYTKSGSWYTNVLPQDSGGYAEIYRRVFKQLGLSIFLPMVSQALHSICEL